MRLRHPRIPVPTARALTIVWTAVVLAVLVGGIVLTVVVLGLVQNRQTAGQDRAELRAELALTRSDLTDQSAASSALADQVESLGEDPVVEPGSPPQSSALVPIPGVRGPAPSFSQVLQAVQESIGAGLREVCGGSCAAEDGADGADSTVPGPAGSDSTVPGPRGPASTVPGPKGDTGGAGRDGSNGTNGSNGGEGRGVVRFDCIDTQIVATYTDDTTQTIPGLVCLDPIEPPEEPTP